MTVTDRVAIVTGSGQGIGAGIAETLARAGANVVVNDIFGDKATATAEAIANAGGKAVAVVADVADEAEVTSLVDHTLAEFGRVDILVNNVGIARDAWLAKMSLENWEMVLRVNLTSQFLTTRAVVPHMIEQKSGRIINISSRAWLGGPGQSNYAASKGAVVSLTRTLALELAKFDITANAIAPALIDTPLFRSLAEDVQERLLKTIPAGRLGSTEDIGNAVLFFAADESSYVTGQLLYICGGRSLGAG